MNIKTRIATALAALALSGMSLAATEVSTKGGIEADAGEFSFQFGGRIQLDYAYFDDDLMPMSTGSEFRRARLFAAGTMYENWDYKAQYDFANGDLATKDLYIRYTGFDKGTLTIGHFKQPFGLEELTSSKYITFMERALPMAFATAYGTGAGYNLNADTWTFAASVYGPSVDQDIAGDEGLGLGARVTFLPMKTEDGLVHLGLAVAQEQAADDAVETVRYRQRPEAHLAERLVDTGDITAVDAISKVGVEAAWVAGPLSLQGEYMMADVARETGQADVGFDGYYAQASYFLDGATRRPYKNGSFGRVKASGVWELGVRYSFIDLNDVDGGITGGELTDITVGANYYVNPNLRFMINYVMAEADYGAGLPNDEPNVLEFRASLDF